MKTIQILTLITLLSLGSATALSGVGASPRRSRAVKPSRQGLTIESAEDDVFVVTRESEQDTQ